MVLFSYNTYEEGWEAQFLLIISSDQQNDEHIPVLVGKCGMKAQISFVLHDAGSLYWLHESAIVVDIPEENDQFS